jgi:hypothetical protein
VKACLQCFESRLMKHCLYSIDRGNSQICHASPPHGPLFFQPPIGAGRRGLGQELFVFKSL